jgi:uncharacterized protein DUF4410
MPFTPLPSGIIRFAGEMFLTLLTAVTVGAPVFDARQQSTDAPTSPVPILVSDFELFTVAPTSNATGSSAPSPNQQRPQAPPASEGAEIASAHARWLIDLFASTLVDTLHKSGYSARRGRGAALQKGALLRGVFAEPDEKNRIRRTLLGGTPVNPKFFLYVGIFNLARPDQPLYQLAAEQPGGSQFGPVITLNNYIPLAKYELDKNPTEEDIRKICAQIAASLTTILSANPNAFAQ